MEDRLQQQCLESETEYQEWRKNPLWYCVKTIFYNNGSIKSEFVIDENTKQPIIIRDIDKPQDGVYEERNATIYYTYHRGYAEAAKQIVAARI